MAIMIQQEDHADIAAQFAAHWGNENFARLEPYDSMVFAAIYHDSQFRDVEAELPIDSEKGRPHGHRTTPFSPRRNDALRENIAWIRERDPYAGLLVSRHHTGLSQNRYGTIGSWQNDYGTAEPRPMRPQMKETVEALESAQQEQIKSLGVSKDAFETNYRIFQVFDLLSLYLCCDGYTDEGLKEERLVSVPTGYDSGEEVEIRITPTGPDSFKMTPYPFDVSPLVISATARLVPIRSGLTDQEARQAYYQAPRQSLCWEISK